MGEAIGDPRERVASAADPLDPEAARRAAIESAEAQWQQQTRGPSVAGEGERKESFRTQALDWEIAPLYTPLDLANAGFDYLQDLNFPGQYPFTRGTEPNGKRTRLWTMAQVTGFGRGMAWAERARYMLDQGLQGLILEYDLPTTNGYDSDNPLVAGEVGRAGMALDSLEDMIEAFDLPFGKLKYLMSVCNAPQPVNLAMILAALEARGVDPKDFVLHIVNGILIEYTCVGRYIYPPEHGLRIATDCFEWIVRNQPHWAPISIIAAQLQPARANPVQEIAFSITIAMAYIDAMLARGFDIDTVAPYFHFVINIDMDFFEGICKLRAFRKLWARTMKERYGATAPAAMKLRVMSSPSTTSLTLQQPLNNIGRLAIMATACALAGAGETMTTPLHDEAHALPSDEAIRVGAAIQHLVAHETGVADTIDPLAGSYYVETLTKKIESAAEAEIGRVVGMGGALQAIAQGYFQRELGHEQFRRQREMETGRRKLVGVNHLVVEEKKRELEIWRLADDMETEQVRKLARLRARRDQAAVDAALAAVREAARSGSNLVEPCLVAVKALATHGEICDAMRAVFGEHHPDSQAAGV